MALLTGTRFSHLKSQNGAIIVQFNHSRWKVQGICRRPSSNSIETPIRLVMHLFGFSYSGTQQKSKKKNPDLIFYCGYREDERRRPQARIDHFELDNVRFPSSDPNDSTSWKVIAIICHAGTTIHSGHYFAWRRCSNGGFVKCSDLSLQQPMSIQTLNDFTDDAYIIVLEIND